MDISKKIKRILAISGLILGLGAGQLSYSQTSYQVSATIPAMFGMNVAINRIDSKNTEDPKDDAWATATGIDFGELSLDPKTSILRAQYYGAVDVGAYNNAGGFTLMHEASPMNGPGGTLDEHVNVIFVKQTSDTESSDLSKNAYNKSDISYSKDQLSGGWLRIYYGLASGKGDAAGITPVNLEKQLGTYSGTITLTLTAL